MFDLGEGCHTSARLTLVFFTSVHTGIPPLFLRRKLLQNITSLESRYHAREGDREKHVCETDISQGQVVVELVVQEVM